VRLLAYPSGLGQLPEDMDVHRIRALPGLTQTEPGPSWHKPFLDLLLAAALLRMVRQWEPDLMHAHNFEGLLVAQYVRRCTGVPVIYHVHNAMGLELHTYFRSRLGRWVGGVVGRWVDAHLTHRASYCILLNEAAVGYFRQWSVERWRVVPPGIDFEPGDALLARRHLGGGPLVLYSGNLDRYQDLDLLLRAFRLVLVSCPEARLVFSTNSQPGPLQARARALGLGPQTVFTFAPDFRTARDLLAAADVAVCPRTVCLGFPIKLLNYMAAGRAIVASAGSACGLHHLDNGWVVDDGDVEAMGAAIAELLHDQALARRLGERARETAENEYTWDRAVDAIEEIYEQTVGQPAGWSRGGRFS
jgi:glycosyltransferase involved in cell wall biosynthesis